jgi:ubiquinone/menaquinone biosynthesis C-methylase UbiE
MINRIKRFYKEVLFPWGLEKSMSSPIHTEARSGLLTRAVGRVLEIGFGTGLNLPHYPGTVEQIVTVDPNEGMNQRAQARIDASPIPVQKKVLSGESLPLDSGSFDCVVSTWTLCSIPNLDAAMSELHRVLKPDGKLLFLEHGLSRDASVAKWQQRLNGAQKVFGDGCQLVRDFHELIPRGGFQFDEINEYYQEKTPRTHGYTYRGIASKC